MRHLTVSLAFILALGAIETSAQKDWSRVFPDISGCVRKVAPMKTAGPLRIQEAVYDFQGYDSRESNPNYVPCGTIALRVEPGARKRRAEDWTSYFPTQKLKVQGREAWANSPLCGNDPWIGSLEVFLDDDTVLTVSAIHGAEAIMEFPLVADLVFIERVLKAHN